MHYSVYAKGGMFFLTNETGKILYREQCEGGIDDGIWKGGIHQDIKYIHDGNADIMQNNKPIPISVSQCFGDMAFIIMSTYCKQKERELDELKRTNSILTQRLLGIKQLTDGICQVKE